MERYLLVHSVCHDLGVLLWDYHHLHLNSLWIGYYLLVILFFVIVLNKIGRKFYAKFIVANFGVMFLYIVFKTC